MTRRWVLAAFGFLAVATPMTYGIVRMIPIYRQIPHAKGPLPSFDVATIKPAQDTFTGGKSPQEVRCGVTTLYCRGEQHV